MENNIKINVLEVQNVKRVKALRLECTKPLTVIGGRNGQGKTSVLDAIAYALGGAKFAPSVIKRDGSAGNPLIRVTLNNGLVVERSGKNSDLKVIDPKGGKSGQQLLNEFVSQLAIDLPRFLHASDAEKAHVLLEHLGIEADLEALRREEKRLYDERYQVGRIADQKKKFAAEMPAFEGVPEEPLSIGELIQQQQAILARNGENQRLRSQLDALTAKQAASRRRCEELRAALKAAEAELESVSASVETARRSASDLQDESTADLEANIRNTEDINAKVRANLDRHKAEMDAEEMAKDYAALTEKIEEVRKKQIALLESVELPLDGLEILDGKLAYNGKLWDCMSGSEQLRVGAAIAQRTNPKCGFVLLDKAEQFDAATLAEFGTWLEEQGLQAICTRVSTGDECSIVIEDGFVVGQEQFLTTPTPEPETIAKTPAPSWVPGEF